ncbi:MAG TPA: twin-arginine translocase subunit TatC [Bacteroidota bacterium]|jgi:sec-independent protein translocase protein TatC|nr:twin-arginine translocase subunit TatC [Bacteroidota bacterium]
MNSFSAALNALFKKRADASNDTTQEMSFLDHLEELRWQIIKALIGIAIASIICGIYADFIVQTLLLSPVKSVGLKTQVLSPYGIVLLYMEAILVCGFILSMPYTLYCLWKFVAPGLLPKERHYISRIVGLTSFCFFAGVAFGYLILLPAALKFFAAFRTSYIELNIALDQYVSFMLMLILGAGLVFELPMVAYFLTKMGILTPFFMRKYRRHAIVAIVIIAAVVTPTPDIVTQLLLAIPMIFLYEISIIISSVIYKKRNQTLEHP